MKSTLMTILRFLVTFGLLFFVAWQTGLFSEEGRREFIQTLTGANLPLLLLALIFPLTQDIVSSLKWYYLAIAIDVPSRRGQLLAYYLMGRFFNLVLPSNIGGDLIRVHLHRKATNLGAQVAAAVFMERFTGLVMLMFLALGVGLFQSALLDQPLMELALAVSVLGLCVIAWLIFDERPLAWLEAQLVRRIARLEKVFAVFRKFQNGVKLYRHQPRALLVSMVFSALFYVFAIIWVWIMVAAFAPETTLWTMVTAVPLIMVIMNVPLSIGNIGVMEFAFTLVLGGLGVPPEAALASALLMRLQSFVSAGIGGLLYAVRSDKAAEDLMHGDLPEPAKAE